MVVKCRTLTLIIQTSPIHDSYGVLNNCLTRQMNNSIRHWRNLLNCVYNVYVKTNIKSCSDAAVTGTFTEELAIIYSLLEVNRTSL